MAITQISKDLRFSYPSFRSLKKWLLYVIEFEKFKIGDIVIVFTNDEYVRKINYEFLKHDYYTDVITFDYTEGNILNADIIISIERVKENAKELGTSFNNELDRVIIHGILHLAGYKDSSINDSEIMRERENFYLKKK